MFIGSVNVCEIVSLALVRVTVPGVLESGNTWPFSQSVNPNYLSVSIETEGDTDDPVTDQMFASVKQIVDQVWADCPGLELVTTHQVISPQSRPSCPGSRWTTERIYALGYPVLV